MGTLLRLLLLVLMLVASRSEVVTSQTCLPPEGALLWNPEPELLNHTVIWGYTVTTYTPCSSEEEVCNATDDSLPVQLVSVEMQEGSLLSFVPSTYQGIPFLIRPVAVDQDGFLTCNSSLGVPVVTSDTNETIWVDASFLSPGTHYFIESSESHPLIDCNFGLRVKVIVKPNTCVAEGQDVYCSDRGLCATYETETNYQCLCCGTYEGPQCEVLNPCLSNPCSNGGHCVQSEDGSGAFTCECSLEYYGNFCENKHETLCDVITCSNNGVCSGNSTSFNCACPDGFSGSHCEVDINDCDPDPCGHGTCVDQLGGFLCHCKPGYHGERCNQQLQTACSLSPCKNHGYCQDLTTDPQNFTYECHCLPGWEGRDCSVKVDPCEPDTCSYHGQCYDDEKKGFVCSCNDGYTGHRCEININDCEPNPCYNGGVCRDGVHSHICLCFNSHLGPSCEFTATLFSPILEYPGTDLDRAEEEANARSLYIVAGTLTAALAVVLVLALLCYVRSRHEGSSTCRYRRCACPFCWNIRAWMHYRKQRRSSLTIGVDPVTSQDCPLADDTYQPQFTREDYARTNKAFDNQDV